MNRNHKISLFTLATSLFLSACGGGGGAGTSNPATGYFIDSPVEGLSYSTLTQSGKTSSDGSFKFVDGENVTFSLYGQTLFSPKGYSYLTPFDVSDTSVNLGYSINLIRFLLALDVDGNPSNGIKLPSYNGTLNVNFNQSIRSFEADSDGKIADFLNSNAAGRPLASVSDAVAHFNSSLGNINSTYTLSLLGRTATSEIKNSNCTNNATGGWRYTFNATSMRMIGSDGFFNNGDGNCTVNAEGDITTQYADIPSGEFLDCAPTCTYKQLNRIKFIPNDVDGRVAVEYSWHTPNTNKIYYVKTILADLPNNNNPTALSTFREVITLN